MYRTTYSDSSTPAALKARPSKKYRHKILDERLTKQRVLAEARILVKLTSIEKEGWNVPAVLGVEWDIGRKVKGLNREQRVVSGSIDGQEEAGTEENKGAWLAMEWIEGKSVKELVREWDVWVRKEGIGAEERAQGEEELKGLLRRIGRAVASMHYKGGVIHGDLTSSNIIVRKVGAVVVNGEET